MAIQTPNLNRVPVDQDKKDSLVSALRDFGATEDQALDLADHAADVLYDFDGELRGLSPC